MECFYPSFLLPMTKTLNKLQHRKHLNKVTHKMKPKDILNLFIARKTFQSKLLDLTLQSRMVLVNILFFSKINTVLNKTVLFIGVYVISYFNSFPTFLLQSLLYRAQHITQTARTHPTRQQSNRGDGTLLHFW